MKEVTYQVNVDTKNAVKGVDNLNESLETTNKEVGGLKTSGKALDGLKKGAKGVAGGFRMMGTALKAAGIGLVLTAFAALKELFEQNQKVVDAFNIAFESLAIAFNDFFNYISKNVETVSGFFKKIFDDPLASVKKLGDAIKQNIIERVKSALEVFGYLGKAMQKLFAGDFKGAVQEVKNAGTEFVDVLTGVDNSVEKATEVVNKGITALTEYTNSTIDAAKANVELKKQADLAAVANQGLIEKYDRQAEQQRQIRDDERKSVADRKKANEELAAILEKQETAMKANAKTQLKLAEANLKKDEENVEALVAKREALNELAAIEATIEGFRSEQKVNAAALQKEEQELISSRLESENNLSIERKRFNAEQIQDERERLLELQDIDKEEAEIGRARLTNEIALYKEGTQAKVDAEIALAEFEEQIYQQKVTRTKELTALDTENTFKSIENSKTERDAKISNANAVLDATSSTLSSLGQIADAFAKGDEDRAKKAFNINKGIGIAQAIISTAQGIMNAYTNPVDVASGVAFAKSLAIGIAGAAQIATISTTQFQPSGGTTSPSPNVSGGGASEPQAPSFNVVGQSQANQVSMALANQPPTQAFVVAGDVTTAQQLQNNTITQATF
jgi:hypothetical protein